MNIATFQLCESYSAVEISIIAFIQLTLFLINSSVLGLSNQVLVCAETQTGKIRALDEKYLWKTHSSGGLGKYSLHYNGWAKLLIPEKSHCPNTLHRHDSASRVFRWEIAANALYRGNPPNLFKWTSAKKQSARRGLFNVKNIFTRWKLWLWDSEARWQMYLTRVSLVSWQHDGYLPIKPLLTRYVEMIEWIYLMEGVHRAVMGWPH